MVTILIYKIGSWNDPQIYIGWTGNVYISPILHLQKQRFEKYKLGKSGYQYSKVFEVLKHKRSYIRL